MKNRLKNFLKFLFEPFVLGWKELNDAIDELSIGEACEDDEA